MPRMVPGAWQLVQGRSTQMGSPGGWQPMPLPPRAEKGTLVHDQESVLKRGLGVSSWVLVTLALGRVTQRSLPVR